MVFRKRLAITAPHNSNLGTVNFLFGEIRFLDVSNLASYDPSAVCHLMYATAPNAASPPSEKTIKIGFPEMSAGFIHQ